MANIDISLNAKDNASGVINGVAEIATGAFRRIGEMATNALAAAGGALVDFAKDSFAGALEAQKGIDALSNAISNLGDKAPITMAGAEALADQFKNLVGGSDDAVLAMVEMATRFDQISGDTLPQFIQQSADLAAKLGLDPVKAAQILGKTLQDMSIDGVGAMGKLKTALGIELPEAQEKAILAMVEAGDVAGAQAVLFDVLGQRTAGAAQIAADSAAGQWAIFKETIADAGEGVALALLPALTQLASDVLPKLVPIIEGVASVLSNFIGYLTGGDLGDAGYAVFELFNQLFGKDVGIQAEQTFYQIIDAVTAFATQAQEWITNVALPAFQQAVAWIQANWPAIQAAIADGWAQAQPILQAIGDFIVNFVIPAFNQAVQWVITNWPTIQATIATVMAQIQAVIQTVLSAVTAFWNEWGDEITTAAQGIFDYFKNIFEAFSAAFQGDWKTFGANLGEAWNILWAGIQDALEAALENIIKIDWLKLGQDIIAAIANGIVSGAGWIQQALMDAATAAMDAVAGFLGVTNSIAGTGSPALAGAGAGGGSTFNSSTSATINVNGAGNPSAVAAEVNRQLGAAGRNADTRIRTGSR